MGELANQPPTITAPTNHDQDIWFKFPDGKPAVVKYDQEPGSDPEGNSISYLFRVALPDTTGLSTLADALLTFARNGNNFEFQATEEVTPRTIHRPLRDATKQESTCHHIRLGWDPSNQNPRCSQLRFTTKHPPTSTTPTKEQTTSGSRLIIRWTHTKGQPPAMTSPSTGQHR